MLLDAFLAQPKLGAEFMYWNRVFSLIQGWEEQRAVLRRIKGRWSEENVQGKSGNKPERDREKRERAERALKDANNDPHEATEKIGKSVKTLNRWLGK